MAQFQNTRTGAIHTVSDELVEMYERKAPEWERLDKQPAPAGKNKRRGSTPASQ